MELLITVILIVIVVRNLGDFFIYNAKSSPKISHVSPVGWIIGWVSLAIVLFYFLNNQSYLIN